AASRPTGWTASSSPSSSTSADGPRARAYSASAPSWWRPPHAPGPNRRTPKGAPDVVRSTPAPCFDPTTRPYLGSVGPAVLGARDAITTGPDRPRRGRATPRPPP